MGIKIVPLVNTYLFQFRGVETTRAAFGGGRVYIPTPFLFACLIFYKRL